MMMKKNRLLQTLTLTVALTAVFGTTAYAKGAWKQNERGYWWQEEDGSYPVSCWKWLDGNGDGVAECYYFDSNGYMAANTVIDNYLVNGDGAWVENGIIQTRQAEGSEPANQTGSQAAQQNSLSFPIEGFYHQRWKFIPDTETMSLDIVFEEDNDNRFQIEKIHGRYYLIGDFQKLFPDSLQRSYTERAALELDLANASTTRIPFSLPVEYEDLSGDTNIITLNGYVEESNMKINTDNGYYSYKKE